jgi:hypothetical protein
MEKARVVTRDEDVQEQSDLPVDLRWKERASDGAARTLSDHEMVQKAVPVIAGRQKCPYLAGRPPCGTHHLFPSGANVCWAEASEGKPYRSISRDTQELRCFGASEGQDGCERYRRALDQLLPPPQFERPPADAPRSPEWALPPRRPPRRRQSDLSTRQRLMAYLAWTAPLGLTVLLLVLLLR